MVQKFEIDKFEAMQEHKSSNSGLSDGFQNDLESFNNLRVIQIEDDVAISPVIPVEAANQSISSPLNHLKKRRKNIINNVMKADKKVSSKTRKIASRNGKQPSTSFDSNAATISRDF
jgi:hypothetical protein